MGEIRTEHHRGLFIGLFDDAALFPPGNAPMARAVPAHREHRRAWYAGLVGPFLCPDTRLAELGEVLGDDQGEPLGLGLIVPAGSTAVPAAIATVTGDPRLRLEAIEVVADRDAGPAEGVRRVTGIELPDGVIGYVEVPRGAGLEAALDALAGTPYRAKFRTGGTVPEAFPGEDEVAHFVRACADRDLPFKCTAGLHHALRNTDPEYGFEQHGFLNLLVHTDAVSRGGDTGGLLGERRPEAMRALAGPLLDDPAVRRRFVSFGTCSIAEPLDDLIALGLLEKP